MPSDRSEPQRTSGWPDVPPAWPEAPAASVFTPLVRSPMPPPPMPSTPPPPSAAPAPPVNSVNGLNPLNPGNPGNPVNAVNAAQWPDASPAAATWTDAAPGRWADPSAATWTDATPGRWADPSAAGRTDANSGMPHMDATASTASTASMPAVHVAPPRGPMNPGSWDASATEATSSMPPARATDWDATSAMPTLNAAPPPNAAPPADAVPPVNMAPPMNAASPMYGTNAMNGGNAMPSMPSVPPAGHYAQDPYKPFVTAGQISGPKTPPAHRQQELWDTVFGENGEAIEEYDDESGRPIWLYALVTSIILVLVGALAWAFLAGPLSSASEADQATAPDATPSISVAAARSQTQQVPRLPAYKGTASPVIGVVTDAAAHITLPRLGDPWRVDGDTQTIEATYGFATRQYVSAGMTTRGKQEFAQVMSGPLPRSLAAKYTTPANLAPVASAVMFKARQSWFPKGNKVAKVAQQRLSRNGLTGLIIAYRVDADHARTTVVVAAVNTGGDLPSIVYVAVPALKDDLLPDITTVVRSIKPIR
jgi:hypothetical protein